MVKIPVDCLHVFREISNYLEGDIGPEARQRMEAHFKVCAHCTAVLDGMRNVVQVIGDGQVFDVPTGFSERLYTKLDAHLARKQ
jgi:predicted anti-sigma-YlaC factor YlaD